MTHTCWDPWIKSSSSHSLYFKPSESSYILTLHAWRITFKVKLTFFHTSHLYLLQGYHDPLNTHFQIPNIVSLRLMKFFYHLGSLLQHPLLWIFSGHRPRRGHRWWRLGGEECHFWKRKGDWSVPCVLKQDSSTVWVEKYTVHEK